MKVILKKMKSVNVKIPSPENGFSGQAKKENSCVWNFS